MPWGHGASILECCSAPATALSRLDLQKGRIQIHTTALQWTLEEISIAMAHTVFCTKYKAEMEGLDEPPFDSDFGNKIYKNVSKKAWGEWVERQKMLLNEYRLQPWTREAQEFLVEQMNEFFFGDGGSLPKEFVAPTH